jgi:hypothetical protein
MTASSVAARGHGIDELMDSTPFPSLSSTSAAELPPSAFPAMDASIGILDENVVNVPDTARRRKSVIRKPVIPKEMQVVFSVAPNE